MGLKDKFWDFVHQSDYVDEMENDRYTFDENGYDNTDDDDSQTGSGFGGIFGRIKKKHEEDYSYGEETGASGESGASYGYGNPYGGNTNTGTGTRSTYGGAKPRTPSGSGYGGAYGAGTAGSGDIHFGGEDHSAGAANERSRDTYSGAISVNGFSIKRPVSISSDIEELTSEIISDKIVIITLEKCRDDTVKTRMMVFIAGVVFAREGHFYRVMDDMYVAVPKNFPPINNVEELFQSEAFRGAVATGE